ncbi:MAG: PAS domain S-box protein [Chloroflexales bacterium]
MKKYSRRESRGLAILGFMFVLLALGIASAGYLASGYMVVLSGVLTAAIGVRLAFVGWQQSLRHRSQQDLAADALRESDERFHVMFEGHGAIMLLIDPQTGMILDANHAATDYYGYTRSQLCAMNINEINSLLPDQVAAECQKALHEERNYFIFPHKLASGIERTVEVYSSPISVNKTQMLLSIIHDITDRKQSERELRELNQTLEERVRQRTAEARDLYENAPIGYYSLDANGILIMINQTQLNWFGYTHDEMVGRPYADFITEQSRLNFQARFSLLKERGWLRDITYECVRKDGTIFPALLHATAVYDGHGVYVMSRSIMFDNTEREKTEAALRESEAKNRMLFEESPDAVVLFDERGMIVQMNRAFELLTGYPSARLVGRSMETLDLVSRRQMMQFGELVAQHLQAHNRSFTTEFRINHASGDLYDVRARVLALSFRDRQHYLTAMHDVTSEKHAEETLRRANADLARAARSKDEFLANMSHELRTPLNAILGISETLQEQIYGPINERQQESLRNIEDSGRHLLALINDILDLSKVEAGRLDLQLDIVPVIEMCQASLVFVKGQALKKSIRLAFHLDDQMAEVEVDPKRLKQMLVNLLINAVKFTLPKGQVSLDVSADATAGVIAFAVQDNGIGIAPEDMAQLFQPFQQLDSSLNRHHEGTGLGLALVRRLAELHGGSVTIESQLGHGSRFTISLPYHPHQAVGARLLTTAMSEPTNDIYPLLRPALKGVRILMAEDNEANIRAIGDYLQAKGYQVLFARNGREAVARASTERPDLILMDIQMPEMDGLEATRLLRATSECAATPIIALTALAMPGDRERCLAAGASEYMTKPVSIKDLAVTINRLLNV